MNSYNKYVLAEKQEKADRKQAKIDAAKARKAEEERIKKEAEEKERAEKEAKELEEKQRLEAEKKEKDIQKKALKKERRELKNLTKEHNFFCAASEAADLQIEDEKVRHMTELDRLCEILSAVELGALNGRLKDAEKDQNSQRLVFIEAYTDLNDKLEKEKLETIEKASSGSSKGSGSTSAKGLGDWSSDEIALLIKAVNLFPAGTNQRWEVLANYVNQHTKTPSIQKNAKETLAKAKELQSGNYHLSSLKEDANKRAYENLEKQKKKDVSSKVIVIHLTLSKFLESDFNKMFYIYMIIINHFCILPKLDDAEGTVRTESAAEVQGINLTPWSAEEQKLLEQALKTYPASLGAERWEKITACLSNRSKKDCMKRYKEIAEVVRAKKAALAAAKKK